MLQVAYGKTCPTLGALLFAWQKNNNKNKNKNILLVVRKVRTDILLADLVCFESQCLPRSARLKNLHNFRHFGDVVSNLRIHSFFSFLFFSFLTSASSCLSSSLLPSSFIIICPFSCTCRRQFSVESACVSLCFVI